MARGLLGQGILIGRSPSAIGLDRSLSRMYRFGATCDRHDDSAQSIDLADNVVLRIYDEEIAMAVERHRLGFVQTSR
jgi:hypothetical protein